jgi:hypothetical protein
MKSSYNNNDQGREELDGIQRQINQKTNESLESTRRMVGLVAESQEIGTNTIVALDQQGEKLNQIEVRFIFLLNIFLNNKIRKVLKIFMLKWIKLKEI